MILFAQVSPLATVPSQGLAIFVGEQLSTGLNAFVDVIVDAGNAEGHTLESLQEV